MVIAAVELQTCATRPLCVDSCNPPPPPYKKKIHRSLLRKDRVNPRQSACLFSLFFSLSVSSSVSSPSPCLLFLRHRAICPQHCSRFNLIQPLRSARFHSDHHRDRMVELSVSSPDSGAHLPHLPHLCLSVLPHRHWSTQTRQKHLLLSLCSTMPQSLLYPIILALCSRTLPFLFFKQTAVLSLNLKLLLYNHGIFVFYRYLKQSLVGKHLCMQMALL